VVSQYNEEKIQALIQNDKIIRNKLKIRSVVTNAQAYIAITESGRSFADYVWQFVDGQPIQNARQTLEEIPSETERSRRMSRQLKKDGFKFVGPTICYAFMQASGMVNDHVTDCFCYEEIKQGEDKMNRINLVTVGVEDMSRSLTFYKAIGFQTPETGKNPPIVFFDNEGSKLELFPLKELAKDIAPSAPPARSRGSFSGITFACNMKSKAEVDAMMTRVEKAGGKVVKPPQDVFWGGYSGYFRDPDGYYWELAYAADWQFDDQNMLIIKKE